MSTPGFHFSKAQRRTAAPKTPSSARKKTGEQSKATTSLPIKEVAALKKGDRQEPPPTPAFQFEKKGGKRSAAGGEKEKKEATSKRSKKEEEGKEKQDEDAKKKEKPSPVRSPGSGRGGKRKPAEKKEEEEKKAEETTMKKTYASLRDLLNDAIEVELAALPQDPFTRQMHGACEQFMSELDPSLLQVLTDQEVTKLRAPPKRQVRLPNPKNQVLQQKEEIYSQRLAELKKEEEQWQKTKAGYTSQLRQSTSLKRVEAEPVKLNKEEKQLLEVASPRKAAANAAEVFQALALNVDDANRTARELEHLRATADDFFTRLATQVHKKRFKSADTKALIGAISRNV